MQPAKLANLFAAVSVVPIFGIYIYLKMREDAFSRQLANDMRALEESRRRTSAILAQFGV